MHIYRTFSEWHAHEGPLHIAIGVFDGLHIGHQAVLARAMEAAARDGGHVGLVTFHPHPIRVIAPNKAPVALLTPWEHKAVVAERLGVQVFVPLPFEKAMAEMAALEFLDQLTLAPIRTIAVGEDWRFGHQRTGDVHLLAREAERRGFQLEAVPPVMWEGDRISSTRIRQALHDGNLRDVESMLGRPWTFRGMVRQGDAMGRTLGFPTANLLPEDVQLPPCGVWVVRATDGQTVWPAVANLGNRPTVEGKEVRLEVHLLGQQLDLYDRILEVEFLYPLRPERTFGSLDELKTAIQADVNAAQRWHEEASLRRVSSEILT
jgi:riboflavin kinase / FMN adenylyltransferase